MDELFAPPDYEWQRLSPNFRKLRRLTTLLVAPIIFTIPAVIVGVVSGLWWISAMEQTLPFIILLFMFTPKHRMQLVLACVILIGPIFRFIAFWQHWDYISTRVLPPAFIDIVGMGCLLAVAMKHKNERLIQTRPCGGSGSAARRRRRARRTRGGGRRAWGARAPMRRKSTVWSNSRAEKLENSSR